jgi:hypothetical protein
LLNPNLIFYLKTKAMKIVYGYLKVFILLFFILCCSSCAKDPGGGSIFLPDLSAQWTNKASATNTFFFLVDKPTQTSSTFTGNENPAGGGAQNNFKGSYTNHDISFTFTSGAKNGKGYSGTINDASNVITLSSSDLGNLVLEKR